jgi:hypothetical protein
MILPLAMVLALTAGAHARDLRKDARKDAAIGQGIICDTSGQAGRFVALMNDGATPDHAVRTINTEAKNERACGTAVIAFTMDRELNSQQMGGKPVSIARITVLAISYDGTHWAPIAPKVQYTVLPAKGLEV